MPILVKKFIEDINKIKNDSFAIFNLKEADRAITNMRRKIYSSLDKKTFFEKIHDINIEHIVPQSFFEYNNTRNVPDVIFDLYHLFLAPVNINAYRSSIFFGEISRPTIVFGPDAKPVIFKNTMKNAWIECKDKDRDAYAGAGSVDEASEMPFNCYNLSALSRLGNNITTTSKNVVTVDGKELSKDIYTYFANHTIDKIKKQNEIGFYYRCIDTKNNKCLLEPCNKEKGKIARAILYIYIAYIFPKQKRMAFPRDNYFALSRAANVFFGDANLKMYQRWNKTYPPEEDEIAETFYIAAELNYLNPFVVYFDGTNYVHNSELFEIMETNVEGFFDINMQHAMTIDDYYTIPEINDFQYVYNKNRKNTIYTVYQNLDPTVDPNDPFMSVQPKKKRRMIDYESKYRKYKQKYLALKKN